MLTLVLLLGSGCGGEDAASDGARASGGSGRDAATAAEQDTGAADAEVTPLPPDEAGSHREQIEGTLRYGFDAAREGDTEKYCSVLVAKLAEGLSNCEALGDGFAYMRENGTAIDVPEILEATLEVDTAYAAAYEQEDREAPSFRTPTDHQLQWSTAGGGSP